MKLNGTKVLLDLSGEPIKTPKEEPATVRWAACEALLSSFEDEQNLSGEEKATRYALAIRFTKSDEVELNVEELALVKKLIGKAFVALVVGRCFDEMERQVSAA